MFELIRDQLPDLAKLEETISALEREHANAQARVQGLANRVAEAKEDDLTKEAQALNRGSRPPTPQEPKLREQLEGAQRELEVLVRRLALAGAERSRYIQENNERLATLLAEAQRCEASKVAEGARKVLADLSRYYQAEDDRRAMGRLIPQPAEQHTGEAQKMTTVWGHLTTRNITGGPARGDLEGTLRHLITLGDDAQEDQGAA